MVTRRRRSRLDMVTQRALIVQFVAGVPARTAAELVGVNRHSATLYYHKLREVITAKLEAEAPFSVGEIEVDESYFGGVRKGKRGRGAAGKVPVFGLLKRSGKVYTTMIRACQEFRVGRIRWRQRRPPDAPTQSPAYS